MGVSIRQKVKDGGWWVFIHYKNRRKSKLVKDKRAALQLARELRHALAAGELGLLRDEEAGLTFAQYAKQYLAKVEADLKRSTWIDYEGCTRRKLIPALGPRLLTDIHRREVKELAASLRTMGLLTVNVRKHLRILSSILSEAVEDELIPANPALEMRKLRRSKAHSSQRRRVDPLTADEVATMLETARTHVITRGERTIYPYAHAYAFILLLARTGMRLSEAIALKWEDVDWRSGCIVVQRAYVRDELSVPKSGKNRRVDMSAHLRAVLHERFTSRFQRVTALNPEQQASLDAEAAAEAADAWIFPRSNGEPLNEANFRRRVFKPLLVAAKMRQVRIHDLRHTYASLLLSKGVDLKYVQEQLGHHSPAFTLSTYAHLLPADRHGLVDQLDTPAPFRTPAAPWPENTSETPISETIQASGMVGGK